jgi:hypothetical protein
MRPRRNPRGAEEEGEAGMSDQDLEAAIDSAGRDKVFAIAKQHGWKPGDCPPRWIWWSFVDEANREGK